MAIALLLATGAAPGPVALAGCASTSPPTRDGGLQADATLDVTARRDAPPSDAHAAGDALTADAYFIADVTSPDAIVADSPLGDAPPGGGDGSECSAPLSFCSGACVDEQSDPNHCGSCEVICVGECSAARCLVTLASDQDGPAGITVNGTYVFWTNTGGEAANNGTVMVVPLGGITYGGTPTTIASGQGAPGGITVDDTNVYWTTVLGGTVMALPLSLVGSTHATPTTLASGQSEPTGVAVDTARIYWTNAGVTGDGGSGTVMALGLGDGGAPATLSSGQSLPTRIAVNPTDVFWANDDAVVALSFSDGGTPGVLATTSPTAIAADATNVYWTNLGTAENQYVDGSVLRISRSGGVVTTLATGQAVGAAIAVDATSVYWTTRSTQAGGGNVVAVGITGGGATTLASGQSPRGGIAVDATSVYWTSDNEGGSVMMLTPK